MREVPLDQLKQMALQKGAKLTNGAKVFNSGMAKGQGPAASVEEGRAMSTSAPSGGGMTLQALQEMALQKGAKLTVGGSVFNASKSKATQAPRPPAPKAAAPAPLPPAPEPAPMPQLPDFAAMLREQESRLTSKVEVVRNSLLDTLMALPATAQTPAPPPSTPPAPQAPAAWSFKVQYDISGRVSGMDAKPSAVLVDADSPADWKFSVAYDRTGAITSVDATRS